MSVVREESELALTRRSRKMYRTLQERYPYAHCELDFDTPLQLLVATVLSAQTTDVTVNKVTPTLFARWPTAAALADAVQATGAQRVWVHIDVDVLDPAGKKTGTVELPASIFDGWPSGPGTTSAVADSTSSGSVPKT